MTGADEQKSGDSETEGHSKLINEAIERVMYTVRERTIREVYRLFDGRFKKKKVQSIQDHCMLAKLEILKKTRDMEVDESILRDLADQ